MPIGGNAGRRRCAFQAALAELGLLGLLILALAGAMRLRADVGEPSA